MSDGPTLRTERLLLRPWRDADLDPYAALNADPEVMRFMPALLTRGESARSMESIRAHFAEHGYGRWAVEIPGVAPFIGFVGLGWAPFEAHFTPACEVGFRLAAAHWRKGYATEASRAAIDHGFTRAGLDEIVSFTATINLPSQGVMKKLGLRRDPADDFDHPNLPSGHRLRRHVLFRLRRPAG